MEGCNSECTGIIKVPFECRSDDISENEPAVSDEESERKSVSSLKTSEKKDVPPREGPFKRIWKRALELKRLIKEKKIDKKKTERKKSIPMKVKKEKIKKPRESVKTLNPEEFTGDRKWLWDEFQSEIGVPKRVDTKPSTALRNLRYMRFTRFVPESYFYNEPKKRDAIFLSSKTPVKKCLCPIRECFCIDNFMKKKKCIPGWCRLNVLKGYIEIPFDIPRLHLFDLCCKRPKIKRYVEKLEATVDSLRPPVGIRGLGKVNNEFCLTKCKKCNAKSGFQQFQYLPILPKIHKTIDDEESSQPQKEEVDNKKTDEEKKNGRRASQRKLLKEPTKIEPKKKQKEESNKQQKEEQKVGQAENQTGDQKKEPNEERQEEQKEGQNNNEDNEEKKDEQKEEKIEQNEEKKKLNCNSYSCRVWTQTEFGPNGELDEIKFSHLLFASVEKIILPDITGNKLYLSQCKYVPDCIPDESYIRLKNMDQLLDVNEIKCRLSKFVSSFFELKDLPSKLNKTKIRFGSFMGCDNETCPIIKHSDINTVKKNHFNCDKNISEAIRGIGITNSNEMNKCENPNCNVLQANDIYNDVRENEAPVVEEINKVSNANVDTLPKSDVILFSDISGENFKNEIIMESEKNKIGSQGIPGNMENIDNIYEKISNYHILNEAKENNSQEDLTKTEVQLVKASVQKDTNSDELKLNMCPDEDVKLISQFRVIKEAIVDNDDDTLNTDTKILDDQQQTTIKDNDDDTESLKEPDRDQGLQSQKDSKTSKNKVNSIEKVLTKKSTYTFSSTFRWLLDKIFTSDQMKTDLSAKSSTNDSKLKLKKSGMSEREVFSMRYTSTASIQRSSSEGNNYHF